MDTAKAAWKFHQDFPDVSLLILLDINENEEQVPLYDLPPVLHSVSGKSMTSVDEWQSNREDLLTQFAESIYGQTPGEAISLKSRVIETDVEALNGKAVRQQVELDFEGHTVTVLIHRPA